MSRVVSDSNQIRQLVADQTPMEEISSFFKNSYMEPTVSEKAEMDGDGKFMVDETQPVDNGTKTREFWFMFRRLFVSGYLKQIFNL